MVRPMNAESACRLNGEQAAGRRTQWGGLPTERRSEISGSRTYAVVEGWAAGGARPKGLAIAVKGTGDEDRKILTLRARRAGSAAGVVSMACGTGNNITAAPG